MPTLHYVSHFEPSGYGLSAIAMVRALHNAGYPVRWTPVKRVGYDGLQPMPWQQALAEAGSWLHGDETLSDLPALAAATAQVPLVGARGFTIAQVVPEHLPVVFSLAVESAHFERVAYTTWEADTLPVSWLRCFDQCQHIVVPSRFNQAVFAQDLRRPVHVVPHVRRHRTNAISAPQLADFRRQLDIAPDEFIFYSINQFEPRKGMSELIEAYVRAFERHDKVALILKTGHRGWADGPYFPQVQVREYVQTMLARFGREVKAHLPKIVLIDDAQMGAQAIDALHAVGDCFVSLTHGEGFGMGASEAACAGKPVLMTGWGGQLDFLGSDYIGNLPYRLVQAPVWPPERPNFWPNQRWATVALADAISALQRVFRQPDVFRAAAQHRQQSIHNQLGETSVVRAWAAAFNAPR